MTSPFVEPGFRIENFVEIGHLNLCAADVETLLGDHSGRLLPYDFLGILILANP
jgi:hypothetical protein